MHIDRSNYEIWFTDWLDGNLDSRQFEQLKLFLDQNPDLREEFNDLAPLKLESPGFSYLNKEELKKLPADISQSQFEYLCAAYLENDLTRIQKEELLDIVNRYPDRKKTFDLIQRTIIVREKTAYKYKSLLRKRTKIQKVFKLSVIGLSSAAAISLIIIVFSVRHGTDALNLNNSANNFIQDSGLHSPATIKETDRILTENMPTPAEQESEKRFVRIKKKDNTADDKKMISHTDDSLSRNSDDQKMAIIADDQKMSINKVPVHPEVNLAEGLISDTLIASGPILFIADVEDERSRAGKFISKTFREKLLKEKNPTDNPLKGYEIAEAGVTGLNKLLGWQMVLEMKNDGNGQPSSVYFSSKILKVSSPVKKREPQP